MIRSVILISAFLPAFIPPALADGKITYAEHVRPLLENKCFSCHNPDKKKGDLDLTSFAGAMTGGGSGAVLSPGDPDGSKLIASVTKKAEPYMPPEGAALSPKEIELLTGWIQGGLLETPSSVARKSVPRSSVALTVVPKGRPEGPPPLPEHVLLEPVVVAPRSTAVTALAASPWAPLVAVAGMKQALVYDADTRMLAGIYPYPEGFIRSLKFSQNGSLLIAGGGRGGKSGNAVVWDVKSGRRITVAGREFDQVMCADISPNHAMIAIGGPSKKVKCFDATTGGELYVLKKHTEWILQCAFSPDGVLLASADRNGGIIISEAANGAEFYILDGHKAACTGLAWRGDSNLLASSSEDGRISLWEMQNGRLVKGWDAHAGGVLSVAFTPSGQIVSAGRDGTIRVWNAEGNKLAESKPQGDVVTRVAALSDGRTVVSGDWQGNVKLWSADKFDELASLSSNPPPIAQRIAEVERLAEACQTEVSQAEAELKKQTDLVTGKEAQVAEARKNAAACEAAKQRLESELAAIPGQVEAAKKMLADAMSRKQAQSELIRQHDQAVAQVKQLEPVVAQLEKEHQALLAEVAKFTAPEQAPQKNEAGQKVALKKNELDAQRGKLQTLKDVAANVPQPLAEFEPPVKAANDQIAALNNLKPAKEKEHAGWKQGLEASPGQIADAEKQLADARAALTPVQQRLEGRRARLAWARKYPVFLKAAQFNVNVLAEREKLEQAEIEVKSLQEGLKEAAAAKANAEQRVKDAKKVIVDVTAKQPALDAAVMRLRDELPVMEKRLEPMKAGESRLIPLAEAQKNIIAGNQAALKNLEQGKNSLITAAQKVMEDIGRQIEALRKQSADVAAKAAAPLKDAEDKKTALAAAEAALHEAKQKPSDADVQKAQNSLNAARSAAEAAEKAAAPLRVQQENIATQTDKLRQSNAAKQSELVAAEKDFAEKSRPLQAALATANEALASLDKQLSDVRRQMADAVKTIDVRRAEVARAQSEADAARKALADAQKSVENSAREISSLDKAMADTRAELKSLEPQITPQRERVKRLQEQYLAQLPK